MLEFIDTCGWSNFAIARSEFEQSMRQAISTIGEVPDAKASSEAAKVPTADVVKPTATSNEAESVKSPPPSEDNAVDRSGADITDDGGGSWLRPSLNFRAGLDFVVSTGKVSNAFAAF